MRCSRIAAVLVPTMLMALAAQVPFEAHAQEEAPGKWDAPWRVLLRAGELVFPEYNQVHRNWKEMGVLRHSQLGKVRLDKYMRYDALVRTPQIEAEQVLGLLPDPYERE